MTLGRIRAGCLLTLLSLCAPSAAQSPATDDPLRDYPAYDQQVRMLVGRGNDAKRAARRLAEAPLAADTIELLLQQNRIDDAFASLKKVVAGADPAQLTAALEAVGRQFSNIVRDQAHGYTETLRQIVAPARELIPKLPRETAARLAQAFVSVDVQLDRGGSMGWLARQKRFVDDYAGTEAALLAEVNTIDGGTEALLVRIDALDRFWKDHPGTVAGAKALYLKGFQLHVNVAITGVEKRGSDPTPRFLQVIDIVKELESGRYPPCEWVDKAPSLVSGFFVSRLEPNPPVFAPGNIDRMLAAYQQFLRDHIDRPRSEDLIDSSLGYIITSKMSELYRDQGDVAAGIEKTLADLEGRVSDPRSIRLFRGQYNARRAAPAPLAERDAAIGKARSILSALAAENAGYVSRKALATLASVTFYARDYAQAIPIYEQYLGRYPASGWAWLAQIRLGQSYKAQGQWQKAADAYRKAATTYASEAVARVAGDAFAARAYDALGSIEESLAASRRARDGWDTDYGVEYTLAATQAPIEPRPATPPPDRSRVRRDALVERVATLERALSLPGGIMLERGRWQIAEHQYDEASATLSDYLKQFPQSPAAGDARTLRHLTKLERALELGAVEGPAADLAAATNALDAIAGEPFDFPVAAARIARAALGLTSGESTDLATTATKDALDRLLAAQRALEDRPPASPVDADVAAIRAEVFRPAGDLSVFAASHWNAFSFPASLPPYLVVNADVSVKLAGGDVGTHTVVQRFPGMTNVLQLRAGDLSLLERIVTTLGGTKRRAPQQIMETPNQPVGDSKRIVDFWNQFFPARPGHWGGWVLETYPIITRIEFLDAARTKASAFVTVGYSGATVVLEKANGAWKAVRLTNQWIT